MPSAVARAGALTLAVVLAGCGKPVDVKQVLQVTDISTGYHDAGVVEGRNKLVPSVTFKLRKSTNDSVRPLSLNVVFKRLPLAASGAGGEEDWEEVFLQNVTFQANETAPLTVRPTHGYTGDPPQSRAEMLANSQFRDMRVHLFAKHGSGQWAEIASFDVARQLLPQ
jgi:hypothetical protein